MSRHWVSTDDEVVILSHAGISSFVPIIGQYGSVSFFVWSIGEALEADEVEAGESVASLTMSAAW
jgi:hypothetical protein